MKFCRFTCVRIYGPKLEQNHFIITTMEPHLHRMLHMMVFTLHTFTAAAHHFLMVYMSMIRVYNFLKMISCNL